MVSVTAKILDLELTEVLVDDNMEKKPSALTGRFPFLQTQDGATIFESVSIMRCLARQSKGIYGQNDLETSTIDQWIDYLSSSVRPVWINLFMAVMGKEGSDPKSFNIGLANLKKNLEVFEKHLKLRNFLVGYSLTLADVVLVCDLIQPMQVLLDAAFRKDSIPNLTRYCANILNSKAFLNTFGRIHFCKKAINPIFEKKQEVQPKVEKAKKAAP